MYRSDIVSVAKSTTWRDVLHVERDQAYFRTLLESIESERASGSTIFPPNDEVFQALHLTPFEDVSVVILGQDPYHGTGQAHGLCFSVRPPVTPPPSLVNIFTELHNDLGLWAEAPKRRPSHGSLESWAKQGVLLLNSVLTVEAHKAGSHAGRGWEQFTDKVISEVNAYHENVVFLLWGAYAQKKANFVDRNKHLVLEAPHPSPLSAHRGFFGCKHFSRANDYLRQHGRQAIEWNIEL